MGVQTTRIWCACVRKFDPKTLKPHRIIIVVGKRGTGKSVLQRDLLYHLADKLDFGLAMTPTEESAETFREHMPDSWIYNGFSTHKLDTMLNLQRESVKKKKARVSSSCSTTACTTRRSSKASASATSS